MDLPCIDLLIGPGRCISIVFNWPEGATGCAVEQINIGDSASVRPRPWRAFGEAN
jgi:hypothetical protein